MHIWCRTIEIVKGMKWDVDNCKNFNYPVFYSLKCEVYHIFQYLFHKYKKKKKTQKTLMKLKNITVQGKTFFMLKVYP